MEPKSSTNDDDNDDEDDDDNDNDDDDDNVDSESPKSLETVSGARGPSSRKLSSAYQQHTRLKRVPSKRV
ncbi:hypothetical protein HZH68_001466 [Vespula germanica]|uniref:Uncharacterized protein n=1 Tax=Vespula germanica TaxID=30212 RepID=A0A834NVL3_VESGE|nr:hypothetical protein HZH68_001466 [Vespula germanica]